MICWSCAKPLKEAEAPTTIMQEDYAFKGDTRTRYFHKDCFTEMFGGK